MAETLPPMSIADLDSALQNPHFSSYVYLGADSSEGWETAKDLQFNIPALRIYRVDAALQGTVRTKFGVPADKVGIVFDWSTKVKQTLTEQEAEDFTTLLEAVDKARA